MLVREISRPRSLEKDGIRFSCWTNAYRVALDVAQSICQIIFPKKFSIWDSGNDSLDQTGI
jgi:hypothetical protein